MPMATTENLYDTTGAAAGLSARIRSAGSDLAVTAADAMEGMASLSDLQEGTAIAAAEIMEEIELALGTCEFWGQHYDGWKPSRSLCIALLDAKHFADLLAQHALQKLAPATIRAQALDTLEVAAAMASRDHAYRMSVQDAGEERGCDWSMCPIEEGVAPENAPSHGAPVPPRQQHSNVVQLATRRRRPARTSTEPTPAA